MNIKQFSYLSDYEDVKEWLEPRKDWPDPLPKDFISESGFVAEEDGEKLAVAWLFMTNAPIAWLGFPITNPKVTDAKRREALDTVFEVIKSEAKKRGYKFLITTSNIDSLIDRYKKHGFMEADLNVTQLIGRTD